MTVWDWLASPGGVELLHAVILLVGALAALLSARAHRSARENHKLLNSHLEAHMRTHLPIEVGVPPEENV